MCAALLALLLSTRAVSPEGAVATAHPLASEAAAQVLRDGGNAVDAAVAGALVLSVVEPQSSGLGGGGFALVWLARERRARVLDFREVAPAAASADMYTRPGLPPTPSLDGALAVAVPGAVKGYAELARRFGSMPLARLAEPAALIAERGFRIGHVYAERARDRAACLRDGGAAAEFLVRAGAPAGEGASTGGARGSVSWAVPAPGARLVREDLARTLRALGNVFIEAEKRLFARRAVFFGDPDQVKGVREEAEAMASPAFAKSLHAEIGERATPAAELVIDAGAGGTSHLSVVDRDGNAVALTTTVNYYFGSCVLVPGTGILLNDEMDDFATSAGAPDAHERTARGRNAVAPGRIPVSSMAPTLVFEPGGRLAMALGAAGGPRIPAAVAQAILHVVDDGMQLDEALAAPRLHSQYTPDVVLVEPNGLDAATARQLQARGHVLQYTPSRWANAHAAGIAASGMREAAADPRYEGEAAAP